MFVCTNRRFAYRSRSLSDEFYTHVYMNPNWKEAHSVMFQFIFITAEWNRAKSEQRMPIHAAILISQRANAGIETSRSVVNRWTQSPCKREYSFGRWSGEKSCQFSRPRTAFVCNRLFFSNHITLKCRYRRSLTQLSITWTWRRSKLLVKLTCWTVK